MSTQFSASKQHRWKTKQQKTSFSPPCHAFVSDPFRNLVHSTAPSSKTNTRVNSSASEQLEGRWECLLRSNHGNCVSAHTKHFAPTRAGPLTLPFPYSPTTEGCEVLDGKQRQGLPRGNFGTLFWQGWLHLARQWRNLVTPQYHRHHCNYSFYAATQLIVTPSFHMLINLQKESF